MATKGLQDGYGSQWVQGSYRSEVGTGYVATGVKWVQGSNRSEVGTG